MAELSSASGIEIFKFKQTGVAALCVEVAAYIHSRRYEADNVEIEDAYFVEDADSYAVVFPRKKSE